MAHRKTVVVLEHIWDDRPLALNKDVSVLPYIDGVCRLSDYELFYGKYVGGVGFDEWIERFKTILDYKDRRIILYLAGHGSNRSLGGKNIKTLLETVWKAANYLNIEGCILGGCFVGQNIDEIKRSMTASNLTWVVGYKHAVDWLPSTLLDINIISTMLSSRQDALTDRNKLESLFKSSASLFNQSADMSTDENGQRQDFASTVSCVIQPRTMGQRPVSIDIF